MVTSYITISWTASPPPVSGYNVYRGTALGNESNVPLNNSPILGTTFEDATVYPGQSYSYAVYAVLNGVQSATAIQIVSAPVPFGPTPTALNLGAALSFGVLASSTVTNVPSSATLISGDVGTFPGTSITGFGSPSAIAGVFHTDDFVSMAAQAGALAAYTAGQAIPDGYTMSADIGGQTFYPGVYNVASSLGITGDVVLDAQGDTNAVFIFQIGSTLTTASSNSAVVLFGNAQASNVFWLVGSSATLNTHTAFAGTIIAQASISVSASVFIDGRLLALTGAVTLNGTEIIVTELGSLSTNARNTFFNAGAIIFDPISQSYQQVYIAGVTAATLPAYTVTVGAQTTDGTVTWISLDPPSVTINIPLPPSVPNTPPAPPAPPSNLIITAEV